MSEKTSVGWSEFKPGIHWHWPDLRASDYHADVMAPKDLCPVFSASRAQAVWNGGLNKVLFDFKNPPDIDRMRLEFRIGSAAHSFVLRQNDWESEIQLINADNFMKNETKALAREAIAQGRTPILEKEVSQLQEMRAQFDVQHDRFGGRSVAQILFDPNQNGVVESSIFWRNKGDPDNEPMQKCRPDYLPSKDAMEGYGKGWKKACAAVDYKTTRSLAKFERSELWDRLGAMRLAHYYRGISEVYGLKRMRYVYLVQEKTPPYNYSFYALELGEEGEEGLDKNSQTILQNGLRGLEWSLEQWREAITTKVWKAPKIFRQFKITGPDYGEEHQPTLDDSVGDDR